ncbi:MAG: hypothetical protein IPI65_17485 [Bacteroidetes bacterium]|nr:hypothetical protein [Bacteroidota bacterium]
MAMRLIAPVKLHFPARAADESKLYYKAVKKSALFSDRQMPEILEIWFKLNIFGWRCHFPMF